MEHPEEYQARMRGSVRFQRFDIEPKWRPGERDVLGFIHDEVVRQGHDPRVKVDGGIRVEWMIDAWTFATQLRELDVRSVERIGELVEQWSNTAGYRTGGVRVGGHVAPDARSVPSFMVAWCTHAWRFPSDASRVTGFFGYTEDAFVQQLAEAKTPDDLYLAFEWIHPFNDGNGRTGKILHNWLLGTLDDPVLVKDHFGFGNP